MKKLYTDKEYSDAAVQANNEGKRLYIITHTEQEEQEVLDYEEQEQEVQVPVLEEDGVTQKVDEEGNPIYETQIQTVLVPVMIEKQIEETITVYDEDGNPHEETQIKTIQVQSSHTEMVEVQYGELAIAEDGYYICYKENYTDGTINENLEQEKAQAERLAMDARTLTPSDVERALYKASGMDFEDLKTLIQEKAPLMDIKAVSIELRANLFYRGATLSDGTRLIDAIGALMGYTSDDMDYLFINKELPSKQL